MTAPLRLAVAVVVLGALWAAAFRTSGTGLFAILAVGGLAAGACGAWVRRGVDAPVRLPGLSLTAGQALLAVGVAVGHLAVGHALLALASQLLPAVTEAATGVYARTVSVPLGWRLAAGALLTGPLEELFWRGAVHPLAAQATARRAARWPGLAGRLSHSRIASRWLLPIVASTLAYAAFHAVTLQLALVAAALLGGLVWGWLVERTGSVGAAMVAHGLWTGLMVLVPPG